MVTGHSESFGSPCVGLSEGHLEPVQKLLRIFWARADCVVPLRANVVAGELDRFEFGLRDFQASLVCFIEAGRSDFQASSGRGAAILHGNCVRSLEKRISG